MIFEQVRNVSKVYPFRKLVPAGSEGYAEVLLVAHGVVDSVKVRFSAGESTTLQLRPVVVIPQEIEIDLFSYPDGCDQYISGDDETMVSSVKVEIENQAMLRVYYKNTGVVGSADSFLNVDIGVMYYSVIEPENIIG